MLEMIKEGVVSVQNLFCVVAWMIRRRPSVVLRDPGLSPTTRRRWRKQEVKLGTGGAFYAVGSEFQNGLVEAFVFCSRLLRVYLTGHQNKKPRACWAKHLRLVPGYAHTL